MFKYKIMELDNAKLLCPSTPSYEKSLWLFYNAKAKVLMDV